MALSDIAGDMWIDDIDREFLEGYLDGPTCDCASEQPVPIAHVQVQPMVLMYLRSQGIPSGADTLRCHVYQHLGSWQLVTDALGRFPDLASPVSSHGELEDDGWIRSRIELAIAAFVS